MAFNSLFTNQALDSYLDLLELEAAKRCNELTAMALDTPVQVWRETLNNMAKENALSSRFALMRILANRWGGDEAGFQADVRDQVIHFRNISMEHAAALTQEENQAYLELLREITRQRPDRDSAADEAILSLAWYPDPKSPCKPKLTRNEAFHLGHILAFTKEEMEWFLLRVFDVAECFRNNESEDLIELYGFLTNSSFTRVQMLKEAYAKAAKDIEKVDNEDRSKHWTLSISQSLLGKVESWALEPDTIDSRFLEWMLEKAPGLDIASRTARLVHRNLAAFAWDLIQGNEVVPGEQELADSIQDIAEEWEEIPPVRKLLYRNGVLSYAQCKALADTLLLENKVQSASIQADNTKAWHVLSTRRNGTLTSAGSVLNSSRTRLADILYGTVQVEKSDLLYLLWFTANLIWQNTETANTEVASERLFQFMDAADAILDAAQLPPFYPPHIMEQSMLLSIASSGMTPEDAAMSNDPSVVYEYILYALTEHRKTKKTKANKQMRRHVSHGAAFVSAIVLLSPSFGKFIFQLALPKKPGAAPRRICSA